MQNLVHRDYYELVHYMYAHTSDTGACTQKHTDNTKHNLIQLKMGSKHRLEMDEDSSMEWETSIKKSIICVNMYLINHVYIMRAHRHRDMRHGHMLAVGVAQTHKTFVHTHTCSCTHSYNVRCIHMKCKCIPWIHWGQG